MKHTKEEILKALHVIKDECDDCRRCEENCPFSDAEGECLINTTNPAFWKINDDTVETWKGLL